MADYDMYNDPNNYGGYVDPNIGPDGKRISPAKSAVAQAKPRDNKGKFLSGAELQAYNAQAQAAQFAAERAHVSKLLGRGGMPSGVQGVPMQGMPSNSQSNFQQILNANSPGRFSNNGTNSSDKWDNLLGRKRTSLL